MAASIATKAEKFVLWFKMKKPKLKANTAKEQKRTAKRITLNKLIAGAPTLAEKWEIALQGGKSPTAIQRLPFEAIGLAMPSPHGAEWQAQAIAQTKKKFVDIFFPALMKDDPKPFEELIQAMAYRRKTTVSLDEFIRRKNQQRKIKPTKKEIGRRFRLALINLKPDELLNIKTVKAALAKEELRLSDFYQNFDSSLYCDDSAIYAAMKELNLRFFRPGDAARWTCGGKVIRILEILPDGTPRVSGMKLEQVEALPGYTCEKSFPNGMTSQVSGMTSG